ncbi:MAG: GNAT family N-acetyltransferase [Pseudonocardia sp.]
MIVRREQQGDVGAVREVVAAAFPGEPPAEVALLDALRADSAWLPRFSLVVTVDERVAGHVVCTRGHVGTTAALGLGPIAVRPGAQRGGVGSALMHAVLGAADACGEPLVALLGEPEFYGRFGFRAAAELGVEAPDPAWGAYFQVRPLAAYRPVAGPFTYAAAFGV